MRRILFLCYGNICRSPFAAAVARSQLPLTHIEASGFHSKLGRSPPPFVVTAASSLGVDVTADYDFVDPLLTMRADRLTSEASVALDAVRDLSRRIKGTGDESEAQSIQVELTAAQERLHLPVDVPVGRRSQRAKSHPSGQKDV